MTTLRSLILKEWFKFFIGAFLILVLLISVAELISGFLRSNVTPIEVIFNHFLELPDKMKLIMPVGCLVASLFSINKLKNRNELTAIFAGGYSRKKFMLDITLATFVVSFSQLFISSFLEPFAISKKDYLIQDGQSKFKNLRSKGLMASTIGSGKMWFKSENYFFSFSTFNKSENRLNDVSIYFYDSQNKLTKKITSEHIKFVGNAWMGTNARIYDYLQNTDFPKIEEKESLGITISEVPDDFKEIEADITTLNIFQLYNYIRKLQDGGINVNEYLVILLEKISISFICTIFGLVAAIGAFRPNRRGNSFGKSLLGVFVFVILYWLINSYFIELGKSSKLDPFLACFGVPFIFGLFLITQFVRNRKLI
jgi:lipopolysaccharide export system permease protein